MASLLEELKRRKVFRVSAVYTVAAWLLIQVADVVLPTFGAPDWVNQTLIFLFLLGFPIAVILSWAFEVTPGGVKADTGVDSPQSTVTTIDRKLIYAIFVLVLIALGFQISDRIQIENGTVARNNPIVLDDNTPVSIRGHINLGYVEQNPPLFSGLKSSLDITTGGSHLVYTNYSDGISRLFVRDLDQLESTVILESRLEIKTIKISPESNWIAYLSGSPGARSLHLIPFTGGASQAIVGQPGPEPNSVTWLSDQELLFHTGGAVNAYSLLTGEIELLSDDEVINEYRAPVKLLDTNYLIYSYPIGPLNPTSRIVLVDLTTWEEKVLIDNAYAAQYVESGHLVFMREDNLYAGSFDIENLEVDGDPVLMIAGIESSSLSDGLASYAVADNGLLIYLQGSDVATFSGKKFVWLDANGIEQDIELPTGNYEDPVISPDGNSLAFTVYNRGQSDIWTHDFSHPGISNRVTTGGVYSDPLWTPDGQSLVFSQRGDFAIVEANASGIGASREVAAFPNRASPREYAPDGTLLYTTRVNAGPQDIVAIDPLARETPMQRVIDSEFNEFGPSISPDGRFIAYSSNETGSPEIYIRPYPDVDNGKWRVSVNGGNEPQWGNDSGYVLHYTDQGRSRMVTAELQLEPEFSVLNRRFLELGNVPLGGVPYYAVSENDGRFLFMREVTDAGSNGAGFNYGQEPLLAVLVVNWFDELQRLAPPNPI
ncbi:MAG: hypothetical protein GKR91_19330 [Pseudomonadales bacterium]|nr:hypothetical protein [Pseudomonadales bacterium]